MPRYKKIKNKYILFLVFFGSVVVAFLQTGMVENDRANSTQSTDSTSSKNSTSRIATNSSSSILTNSTNDIRPPIPHRLQNFSEAKRLAGSLFEDHRYTFYCGCKFDKHRHIDLNSCGYCIQGDRRRANRIEWEHIMPVSRLAAHLPCWKNRLCSKDGVCYKGRRCCQISDPWFRQMEADLHNLVPEIGELNKIRSNFRFGVLPHVAAGQFGACEFKIDETLRRVEPRAEIRGMIARAYLYMSQTYGVDLSKSQQQLFRAWNREYPPDNFEKIWDQRIKDLQGNHNPFIKEYEANRYG